MNDSTTKKDIAKKKYFLGLNNIDVKGKKKYKFKKLKTVANTIGVSAKDGSHSCNRSVDNLSGYPNFNAPGTSNTATVDLKTNTLQVHKRFFKTSEENIFAIKENRFEKSIIKSTEWGVKIFKDWLKENDINDSFEFLSEPIRYTFGKILCRIEKD